jgi:CspA family cold shock protein
MDFRRGRALAAAPAPSDAPAAVTAERDCEILHSDRGFGFLGPDDGGKDVFVHISAVERSGLRGVVPKTLNPTDGRDEP